MRIVNLKEETKTIHHKHLGKEALEMKKPVRFKKTKTEECTTHTKHQSHTAETRGRMEKILLTLYLAEQSPKGKNPTS